jgi:hypothetical protein
MDGDPDSQRPAKTTNQVYSEGILKTDVVGLSNQGISAGGLVCSVRLCLFSFSCSVLSFCFLICFFGSSVEAEQYLHKGHETRSKFCFS